jgi:hypothetical protein
MVVVLRNAHIANRAVFRPRWFVKVACSAFVIRLVDLLIIVFSVFFNVALNVLFCYFSGRGSTGLIIYPKADEGQNVGNCYMNAWNFIVRHVFENSIDFVKSESL